MIEKPKPAMDLVSSDLTATAISSLLVNTSSRFIFGTVARTTSKT
jgi:hypothetical protein